MTKRNILFGLLTWAVPLAVSFLFYDRAGNLYLPLPLFKSLMVVLSGGLGAWLLVLAFRRTVPSMANAIQLGLLWLAMNILLDLLILVPFTGIGLTVYFADIGLRYILIPIMAVAIASVASSEVPKG